MSKLRSHRRRRRGFSLIEISVSTGLVVMLSMLLSNAWIGLGRPLIQSANRCRIAQEASLALDCLARDLGGHLPEGDSGGKLAHRFVGWKHPTGAELMLCFDSSVQPNGLADWGAPDTVIVYQVVDQSLIRSNQSTAEEFVAAQNVDSLTVQDLGGDLQIDLAFTHRAITQSYTLIAKKP